MITKTLIHLFIGLTNQIFLSKAQGTDITKVRVSHQLFTSPNKIINGRWFVSRTLRGFDFDVMENGVHQSLRILEQNPNKEVTPGVLTSYAIAARSGKQLAWVMGRSSGYIGHIDNGVWIPQNDQGVTKVSPGPMPGTFKREFIPKENVPISHTLPVSSDDIESLADVPEVLPNEIEQYLTNSSW